MSDLPVDIDATYADDSSDASVKAHQQHHDSVHALYNDIAGATPDLGARGIAAAGHTHGTVSPLALKGNEVKLVYFTAATSGVAADGWYFPDETSPTLTGRLASITWEGTSAQIPLQGTTDTSFKTGDTALVRATSL
jgi:hypothetical protein